MPAESVPLEELGYHPKLVQVCASSFRCTCICLGCWLSFISAGEHVTLLAELCHKGGPVATACGCSHSCQDHQLPAAAVLTCALTLYGNFALCAVFTPLQDPGLIEAQLAASGGHKKHPMLR